jgi:hypothetical protein
LDPTPPLVPGSPEGAPELLLPGVIDSPAPEPEPLAAIPDVCPLLEPVPGRVE